MSSSSCSFSCPYAEHDKKNVKENVRKYDIYFDNNATTKISDVAISSMMDIYENHDANPSSVHARGSDCKTFLDSVRKKMLSLLDADPSTSTVVFTSGCTEANNMAVSGIMEGQCEGKMILTTSVEHDSIINVVKNKYDHRLIKCDRKGKPSMEHLTKLCMTYPDKIAMVSVMAAQNEIGTINDLATMIPYVRDLLSSLTKGKSNVIFHVDATQMMGKYRVSVRETLGNPDLVTGSSHKFHGPKGVGFMYVRNTKIADRLVPLSYGGSQEFGLRPGTENLAGITGMVAALGRALDPRTIVHNTQRVTRMRNHIIERLKNSPLLELLDSATDGKNGNGSNARTRFAFNGDTQNGLYNTINFTVFYDSETHNLARMLDQGGICVSPASACTKGKKSHVLKAIGVRETDMHKTIRVSLSEYNTMAECDAFVDYLEKVISKIRLDVAVSKKTTTTTAARAIV